MKKLTDQIAVVTGAAQGIGRGIADVLGQEGARVIVADLDAAAAEATAAELRAAGSDAHAYGVDVTDRAALDALAASLERIDIVAANAGIYPHVDLSSTDTTAWDRVMNVNVKGAMQTIQAFLPAMASRSYGRIVLMSSITGPFTGQPGYGAYGASKAAMLGLMRSVAIEVATAGITVNAVLPGNVETPGFDDIGPEHRARMMTSIPMKYFADPTDIGWAVRFLASPEARYITGQTLIVDGGQVLPEAAFD